MQWDKIIPLVSFLSVAFGQDFEQCGRTLPDHDITSKSRDKLNAAELGEFPHMCTLFTEVNGFNVFIGGASLIANNKLLTLATAVHKMRNFTLEEAEKAEKTNILECEDSHDVKTEMFVSCGDTDLQSNNNPEKQVSRISKILIHPEYNQRSLINDLAVLIVETPFIFTASVGRVCLPGPQESAKEGTICVATGHGRDTFKFGSYSQKLRKVNLPTWDSSKCEKTLNDKFFANTSVSKWTMDPSFLCAGGEMESDTCEGDGGGPLVTSSLNLQLKGEETEIPEIDIFNDEDEIFNDEDDDIFNNDEVDLRQANTGPPKIVQVGVIAWGIECGMVDMPSVYSSVIEGRCWLDQVMSCYSKERSVDVDITASNLDLRTTDDAPDSIGSLTQGECGAWLETEGSKRAACGCKQILQEETIPLENTDDYDLRDADYDLRTTDE